MYVWNKIQGCHGKSCVQQEEDSLYQQIGLKFEEETSKMLHMKHGFVWCWNLDASGSRSEIPGRFWNVVLEKDGKDQLDRSCEKWRRVRVNEQRNILHEIRKRKANWIGHTFRRNCLLKQIIEGKIKGEMEVIKRRGRRCKKLLDELKETRGYSHLKEEALARTMWRNRFGGGYRPVVRQNNEWMNIRNVEDCKILQFHLDAVQNWGLDKEQNIEKITFLLFHAKNGTSLVN